MGVPGLLPLLKPAAKMVGIRAECSGSRTGHDGHVWLHQFAMVFYEDVVERADCRKVTTAMVNRAKKLLANGPEVTIILDGQIIYLLLI